MTVSRTQCGLRAGTVLHCNKGWIVLTSSFDERRSGYEYRDLKLDVRGKLIELASGGCIAPRRLLGAKIFWKY